MLNKYTKTISIIIDKFNVVSTIILFIFCYEQLPGTDLVSDQSALSPSITDWIWQLYIGRWKQANWITRGGDYPMHAQVISSYFILSYDHMQVYSPVVQSSK